MASLEQPRNFLEHKFHHVGQVAGRPGDGRVQDNLDGQLVKEKEAEESLSVYYENLKVSVNFWTDHWPQGWDSNPKRANGTVFQPAAVVIHVIRTSLVCEHRKLPYPLSEASGPSRPILFIQAGISSPRMLTEVFSSPAVIALNWK